MGGISSSCKGGESSDTEQELAKEQEKEVVHIDMNKMAKDQYLKDQGMTEQQMELQQMMGAMFGGNIQDQMAGLKKFEQEKKRETEKKGKAIMPKLKRQKTANRVEAFEYIANAIALGLEVKEDIYATLFDQYDTDNSGSLDMEQIKKLIKDVSMSEISRMNDFLTSGELEIQMKAVPMGEMMIPMARGQIEAKRNMAQEKVKHIDKATVEEVRQKLDIKGDGKVTKEEFLSRVEQTFWFEEQMQAMEMARRNQQQQNPGECQPQ